MMDFRMKCLLCSRSALVIVRRDKLASYAVDCPRCGRYRLSNQFAKHYALYPEAFASLPEKQKAIYQVLIRQAAATDRNFTFQWQDIQRPVT